MSVVFPAPSGPTSAVSAPRRTSRDTLSSDRVTTPLSLVNVLWILAPETAFAIPPAALMVALSQWLVCRGNTVACHHLLAGTRWRASRGGGGRTDTCRKPRPRRRVSVAALWSPPPSPWHR